MNKIFLFTFLVLIGCLSDRPKNQFIIIKDINVIDVLSGQLLEDHSVILKDSLIHAIEKNPDISKYSDVQLIEGKGKYLIPGLWDMHFHMCWSPGNDTLLFDLLLEHGITGIRDMGGDLQIQNDMKLKLQEMPGSGPDIVGSGPILDGNPAVIPDFSIAIDQKSDIKGIIDSLAKNGSDFIKTYSLLKESELLKIAEISSFNDLNFSGHLSEHVNPEYSIELGLNSIEHLNRLDELWMSDSARMSKITGLMRKHYTWICPTLIIYSLKAQMNDPSVDQPEFNKYISQNLQMEWNTSRTRRLEETNWPKQKSIFEKQKSLVSYLNKHGIKILAGSDFAGMPYVYPGIGLHQELKLLRNAGLSAMEVLSAATINPAEYLSIQDKYGSISIGKYADMIILDRNPLEQIDNTLSIDMVFKKGKIVVSAQK